LHAFYNEGSTRAAYTVHYFSNESFERFPHAPPERTTVCPRAPPPSLVSTGTSAWKRPNGCGGRRRPTFECEEPRCGALSHDQGSVREVGLEPRFSVSPPQILPSQGGKGEKIKTQALQDAILNSAYFSSIATDEKGVIQIFNIGAERMLGYAASDVIDQITPADISDPKELIARAAELSLELGTPIAPGFEALVFKASRGIEDIYELTYTRKDGSHFPAIVSVTALRDVDEGIIGYLLIGTDNTAKHEIEAVQAQLDEVLRDQQFYSHSLIESSIDALMMTDPQGIISDVNNEMMSLTGRTRNELIGTHCKEFFTDPDLAATAIERVLTENRVTNYELTVRSKSGHETLVSYNAATFHDRNEKLQGVFAVARDVTERKRFELALLETNLELEHASKMKSEFLATMSHELRTPLNAIIGFSEALKDGLVGGMPDSQREYVGDIFTSGQHLLALINDILDLSKVEAGMMTLELESANLTDLLSSSLSIVKETAVGQRVRLVLEMDEDIGVFQLDVRKTKQIMYNLLSNAVKFSGHDGVVTLTAQRVSRSAVGVVAGGWPGQSFTLAESEFNEFVQVTIRDAGIGISVDNMTKLFRAFSQIDSSLARRFEGTGLGLAMVKQLAELHGGAVAVASSEGDGSIFAVWLPIRSADGDTVPFQVEDATRIPLRDATGNVALVVEDDDHAAELVRLLLEAEGFSVLRAASAEEALVMATLQPLSLITVDIELPGIDGWEFLVRIREFDALAHVPVVIIAGLVDSNMALASGAAAVLQKPISRAQLSASLVRLGLQPPKFVTRTILVVDDDPKAVEVIAAFLPISEYTVVRAFGGAEAIALAGRLRPDLILLDLVMPDVSGFAVVEALQCDSMTAHIPIVIVTAKSITADDRSALANSSGTVVEIVEKSAFDRAGLIAGVRRATRQPVGRL
jgi:PAS domain S-box-containing protein